MFKKKLEFIFISMIVLAVSVMAYNYYNTYTFKNNPLAKSYLNQIESKKLNVLEHMQKNFGYAYDFEVIVSDKIDGRLYGLTSYKDGEIKIYLNKKVMKESFEYMIDSVIAHEYAHALIFKLGHNTNEKQGHSKEWQETCVKLGGKECAQYVNQHEIIMSKMPF